MDGRLSGPQFSRFIGKLAEWVATEASDHLQYFPDAFSSPIEHAFWLAWKANGWVNWLAMPDTKPIPLVAQHEVIHAGKRYVLDFAILHCGTKLAIELDGHAFHERTPEQVDYRNSRDAALQDAGWKVIHFSGRQILDHPDDCANAVQETWIDMAADVWEKSRG